MAAIRAAEKAGDVDFGYLLATAKRESGLDPTARAKTSSARGLFQFTEQTWLRMMRSAGAENGFAAEAGRIVEGPRGQLTVADPAERARILGLRNNPEAASVMAAELASDNRDSLRATLGREPSDAEVYMAHFLGARGAGELIRACKSCGDTAAASLFPAAARSNKAIFYEDGRARTVAEVRAHLARGFDDAQAGGVGEAKGIAVAATGKGSKAIFNALGPFRNLVTDMADLAILAGLKVTGANRERASSAYLDAGKQRAGLPSSVHVV